jgi:pilus assembly protein Flp/PilA
MSKFFSKNLRRFLRDEDGPTAVEYAVMVSLIAAAVIVSVGQVAVAMKNSFNSSGAVLNPVLGP